MTPEEYEEAKLNTWMVVTGFKNRRYAKKMLKFYTELAEEQEKEKQERNG